MNVARGQSADPNVRQLGQLMGCFGWFWIKDLNGFLLISTSTSGFVSSFWNVQRSNDCHLGNRLYHVDSCSIKNRMLAFPMVILALMVRCSLPEHTIGSTDSAKSVTYV